MELARFFSVLIRIALLLALCGQLKSCTLTMLGLAAENTQTGIVSYVKFTKMLQKK